MVGLLIPPFKCVDIIMGCLWAKADMAAPRQAKSYALKIQ